MSYDCQVTESNILKRAQIFLIPRKMFFKNMDSVFELILIKTPLCAFHRKYFNFFLSFDKV